MTKPLRPLLALPLAALLACSPQPEKQDAGLALKEPEVAAGAFPENLHVIGTEPFWSVKVEGDALAYTTPETMDAPRLLQATTRGSGGDGLHLTGEDDGQPFRLEVRRAACSDGMSDNEYPFSASLLLDGNTVQGCAFDPASPPPLQ